MARKKILIVEDESGMVETVRAPLEERGFEVLAAADGWEGLERAKNEMPDLIILDLMLPKLDGYQACRILKFDEKYKDIPIIMLTARAQESDKKMGEEVGTNAYITKPFKLEALLDKIHELLVH